MMSDIYKLIQTDSSLCSTCGKPVKLMCCDYSGPAFYICFQCESVGQVGVGPVLLSDEDDLNL